MKWFAEAKFLARVSRTGRRSITTTCLHLFCTLYILLAASAAYGANAKPAKRVLIISTGSRFSPGFARIEQSALDTMSKLGSGGIDFYSEYLDIIRFPSESYQRIFRNYLRDKYADNPPDLLMLFYVGNLGIATTLLQQLFPEVPVVVGGFTEEKIANDRLGSLVSGFAQHVDPRATMELILRLQPETRRIVIIGGTAEVDRLVLDRTEEAARSFAGQVEFDFWDKRPLAEIRNSVTSLPPRIVLLFTGMYRDAAGETFIPARAAQLLAESAKVPLYVLSEAQVGVGSVGGFIVDVAMMGKRAGELANRILGGAAPASLPFESRSDGVPMFDWRALQRWGVSESRLPANSIVRFRPASLWDEHRWTILGALVIFAVQAGLISALLIQRRRRRQADNEIASLAGRLITAQEAERSRIARDLHDDINQQLASLSIALSGVKRRLQNGEADGVAEEVARLQQRIVDVTHVTRQLSHDLHPGVLRHAGLVAALRGHCAEFGLQHGIDVRFSADGVNGVPDETALCLYRVTQEALRNIAAHAAARTARVALRPSATGLELSILDDGQGFDLAEAKRRGGVGLVSLDERARLIGGSLQITTQPQRGTELQVSVPLRGAE